ncbi:hypothetical protein OG205_23175 [Lentzea sp. NBC_00516]|uniref:hypothetical protein n=1 Tax=Lentzea sp. NBC_00516 TaxID=2903582 RepID=UPI002E7FF561|nr:hypothetical protein [Lentzea sp. NBC_00516]WUD21057.1 hypothetical protein OG205_23175 [Lentzea sp. NBC_00516]
MDPGVPDVPFDRWWHAMRDVAATEDTALAWRRHRYTFAHELGQALAGGLTGPAVYGVWLQWGLLYVGQTLEAGRRLKDLAIGESHHLANTFPPEIWHRVVVVGWSQLPPAAEAIDRLGVKAVGEGLEHRLQASLRPLANAARRVSDGTWREVDWERSNSLGARTGRQIDELFVALQEIWNVAAASPDGAALPSAGRVVFPSRMLRS